MDEKETADRLLAEAAHPAGRAEWADEPEQLDLERYEPPPEAWPPEVVRVAERYL